MREGANLYEMRKQAWRAAIIADKEACTGKGSATLRTSEPPATGRRHNIKDTSNGPRDTFRHGFPADLWSREDFCLWAGFEEHLGKISADP